MSTEHLSSDVTVTRHVQSLHDSRTVCYSVCPRPNSAEFVDVPDPTPSRRRPTKLEYVRRLISQTYVQYWSELISYFVVVLEQLHELVLVVQ